MKFNTGERRQRQKIAVWRIELIRSRRQQAANAAEEFLCRISGIGGGEVVIQNKQGDSRIDVV
jgi:hypothetical protein